MQPLPPGATKRVHDLLCNLTRTGDVDATYHPGATLDATAPFGHLTGAALAGFWADLRAALPDMERRDLICVGGTNRDDPRRAGPRAPHLVATLGHLQGTFANDLAGIPATHGVVHLRYAEAHWLDGGLIRESRVMLDLVDLMRQSGHWPLPPSLGAEGLWPGPAPQDGLRFDPAPWEGPDALDTVFAMHQALLAFDGKSLDSMDHAAYWTPDFMYYAGGGIGATRGLAGFRAHHQIPFLRAFPDRWATGHFIRITDGPYAVTGGIVRATHRGPWLGMTGTGHTVDIPVMDFYRLEGTKIAENWLPIDTLHIAAQMGNDLLSRVAHQRGHPVRQL